MARVGKCVKEGVGTASRGSSALRHRCVLSKSNLAGVCSRAAHRAGSPAKLGTQVIIGQDLGLLAGPSALQSLLLSEHRLLQGLIQSLVKPVAQ